MRVIDVKGGKKAQPDSRVDERVLKHLDSKFSLSSPNRRVRALRVFFDMCVYLFGREGTILISSISFNFLVSVFPIIVLLLSLAGLFGLEELRRVIFESLAGFFPISQEFIIRNLRIYSAGLGPPQVISVLLIAWAGSTFFFALEAGLDSAYRARRPRHFVHSQVVGTGMAVISGVLIFLTIWFVSFIHKVVRDAAWIFGFLETAVIFLVSASLIFVLVFALYDRLSIERPPLRLSFRGALAVTAALLIMNQIFRISAGSWRLETIYGPFFVSVTLLFWAYSAGSILIGGARLIRDGFFGKWRPKRSVLDEFRGEGVDPAREESLDDRKGPVQRPAEAEPETAGNETQL